MSDRSREASSSVDWASSVAQLRILRDLHHPVPPQHCVQVESGPPHDDREAATPADLLHRREAEPLEAEHVELLPRIKDVNQVIGDPAVLLKVLAGADIHPPIDLAGVGGDYLAAQLPRNPHTQPGLARGGRPQDHQCVKFHVFSKGRGAACRALLSIHLGAASSAPTPIPPCHVPVLFCLSTFRRMG